MIRFTIIILFVAVFIAGCSDKVTSSTPAVIAAASNAVIIIAHPNALFAEMIKLAQVDNTEAWDKKYIGKTLRLEVLYWNSWDTTAIFVLQPASTGTGFNSARSLHGSIQAAGVQRTVQVTKDKTLDMSKFKVNDVVTIDIIVTGMKQLSELTGECVKAEKN